MHPSMSAKYAQDGNLDLVMDTRCVFERSGGGALLARACCSRCSLKGSN